MIFIVLPFISVYSQTIQFDSSVQGTLTPAISCNGITKTSVINFSGTFANIPQVIITQDKIDLSVTVNFKFRITQITLTSFTVELKCASYITSYAIMWYAIDSAQVEVINCFSIANPTATTTYSHSNPYAVFGFVTITSLQIIGGVSFNLVISSINATHVTTFITDLTNLTQIGYQIILGVDSAFGNYSPIQTKTKYSSPTITLQPNNFFVVTFVGFDYKSVDGVRLRKNYLKTDINVSYIIDYWYASYTGNIHIQLQIPYLDYIKVNEAFKATHLNIRTLQIFLDSQPNTFQIMFKQPNKQYSNIGTYTLLIDKATQTLDVNYFVICNLNDKIIAKQNYCGQCSKQTPFEQTKVCFGTNNTIRLFSRFSTLAPQEKSLTITITANSLSVTQLVLSGVNLIQLNLISVTKQKK